MDSASTRSVESAAGMRSLEVAVPLPKTTTTGSSSCSILMSSGRSGGTGISDSDIPDAAAVDGSANTVHNKKTTRGTRSKLFLYHFSMVTVVTTQRRTGYLRDFLNPIFSIFFHHLLKSMQISLFGHILNALYITPKKHLPCHLL